MEQDTGEFEIMKRYSITFDNISIYFHYLQTGNFFVFTSSHLEYYHG